MPCAFGLDQDGNPDAEAQMRLTMAYEIASKRLQDFETIIFLGAGMIEYAQQYDVDSLASASYYYLLHKKGWYEDRMVMRAIGYSTVTEIQALCEYVCMQRCFPDRMQIEVVSSWWHVPRVKAICRILLSEAHVIASDTAHKGMILAYDIAREIPAFPYSVYMARKLKPILKECAHAGKA